MQRATIGRVIEGANGGTKSNDVGGEETASASCGIICSRNVPSQSFISRGMCESELPRSNRACFTVLGTSVIYGCFIMYIVSLIW